MNRIVLLGNGFDLAHNLKTSYNDFMLWYLTQAYETAYHQNHYEDGLLTINREHNTFPIANVKSSTELVAYYYKKGFHKLTGECNLEFDYPGTRYSNPFTTRVKSSLFKILLNKCSDCNWVEIENEYYRELKNILRTSDPQGKGKALEELNNTLKELILHLHKYLTTLPYPKFDQRYIDIIDSEYHINTLGHSKISPTPINEVLVLNFNYTSTVVQYLNKLSRPSELNYIHGKLNDPDHPLIFGFGDEIDKDYQQIEDEQDNRFFTYIKSFWYFKNPNYRNLTSFIESEKYEVFILGHSCGLSDRTMLNMLFEHDNCKNIKIYYYENEQGENNFTTLTHEISRHFKDKKAMRNKIINIKNCSAMPQIANRNETLIKQAQA